jgi:hypothetical protein
VLAQAEFAYHRSVAPMLWVLASLMVIEAGVLHFLIALWKPWIAAVLSIASLAMLVWLILFIRSFRRRPVELTDAGLIWRVGFLRPVAVPVASIAGLREAWDDALVRDRATLNLALLAWPNVVIDLTEPIMLGKRRIVRLAHKLDDRDAFVFALTALLARG